MKLIDILREKAEFGKVAFGSYDTIAKMQGGEPEPDTREEAKLLKALKDWVLDPTRPTEAIEAYMQSGVIQAAKKKYPKVFAPSKPNGTVVYRGLENVNKIFIQKVLDSTDDSDWTHVTWSNMYVCNKPVSYSPRGGLQSWTYDPKVAKWFGTQGMLITKLDDNFYFNTEAMGEITGMAEGEVIHYGEKFKNPVYLAVADFMVGFSGKTDKARFQSATSYLRKVAGGDK
jgi:hypothetical protein